MENMLEKGEKKRGKCVILMVVLTNASYKRSLFELFVFVLILGDTSDWKHKSRHVETPERHSLGTTSFCWNEESEAFGI